MVRLVLPGLVILLATLWTVRPVSDPDSFWHIAAGDYLRRTWTFNGPDPWSSQSSRPWRLHEWLPELIMSYAQQIGGLPAAAWLLPLGTVGILVSLWLVVRRRASLLVSALVMAMAIIGMVASLSLRPHLVTFALIVLVTGAWLTTAEDGKARWWLIPLTWVWACSHGMWFIGPAVGVVTIIGMIFDRSLVLRRTRRLFLIPVGGVMVAALTPVGPELLSSPFQVQEMTQFIEEWRSPALSDPGFVAFLALSAITIVGWSRTDRRVPWTRILLLGLAVGLSLLYIRTVAVGTAVVAPLAAATLQDAMPFSPESTTRREIAVTLSLAIVGLSLAMFLAPAKAATPVSGATDLNEPLEHIPAGTVVCNEYSLGGWLIWAHPQLRPIIDGRTEVYSLEYVKAYMDFHQGKPGWERFPKQVGCEYALLGISQPPSSGLVKQEGWQVLARGDKYVLLGAPRR